MIYYSIVLILLSRLYYDGEEIALPSLMHTQPSMDRDDALISSFHHSCVVNSRFFPPEMMRQPAVVGALAIIVPLEPSPVSSSLLLDI